MDYPLDDISKDFGGDSSRRDSAEDDNSMAQHPSRTHTDC